MKKRKLAAFIAVLALLIGLMPSALAAGPEILIKKEPAVAQAGDSVKLRIELAGCPGDTLYFLGLQIPGISRPEAQLKSCRSLINAPSGSPAPADNWAGVNKNNDTLVFSFIPNLELKPCPYAVNGVLEAEFILSPGLQGSGIISWPLRYEYGTAQGDVQAESEILIRYGELLAADINADGSEDAMDLVSAMKELSGENPGSGADLDGSGRTDIMDIILLMKLLAGVKN